jgi:hypothetical protein
MAYQSDEREYLVDAAVDVQLWLPDDAGWLARLLALELIQLFGPAEAGVDRRPHGGC